MKELEELEKTLKPRGEELKRVREELASQFKKMGRCAHCDAENAAKRCARCKLIRYCRYIDFLY